jgi:Ni/Co efflux regulator RcnB
MRRLLIPLATIALTASPVAPFAREGGRRGDDQRRHPHAQRHRDNRDHPRNRNRDDQERDGRGVTAIQHVAIRQCDIERAALGVPAFRAKYGPGPFKRCVAMHVVADRPALQQCLAERAAIGVPAFRARYGRPHALRNCIKQKTGTP